MNTENTLGLLDNCLQIYREDILIHKVINDTVFIMRRDQMARV
jgi:hypothetical protein